MNRNIIRSIIIILVICFITPLFLGSTSVAQAEITFKDLMDDYDDITETFFGYNDGDIVTIKDEIIEIHYSENPDHKTYIWFKSEGSRDKISKHLEVIGNAEDDFKKGQVILVDIYITEDTVGHEFYISSIEDMLHYEKAEEPDEEKHGIEILGFQIDFPEYMEFLDNNYGRFLIQFLIWLIIAGIVIIILDPVIKKATEKTETKIDDIILEIIRRPILILIVLYGIVVSLQELELPSEFMYWINGAYSIGFFLMMIWIGYRVFQGVLMQVGQAVSKRTGYQVDKILVPAIQKLGAVAIGFIVLMTVLSFFQIDLTLFVAGGVVISMVIAFAAQDTLSNFFSGMFLILEPKFKEGDMIYFEGDTFVVKKIGMRTTQLYDLFKHIDVVMPNNKLANEKLVNITEPDRRIKDSCEVGVAYGSDPKRVQGLLIDVVMNHPDIITDDPDREPFTRFTSFGDSSINFKVGFWVRDLDNRFKVVSEINQEIYYRLAREGIEIPFPQRDINIKSNEIERKKNKVIKKKIKK